MSKQHKAEIVVEYIKGKVKQLISLKISTRRRVKGEVNFISLGSKILEHFWRRPYDPAIIERTTWHVLCPFAALFRSFLKRCTLTNKEIGTIWRALFTTPQRRQSPDLRLIVNRDSFSLWIWARLQTARSTAYFNGCAYIYWTWRGSLLYYFIKWDYMAFMHLVKVMRDVFEDKCHIWTRFSEVKVL